MPLTDQQRILNDRLHPRLLDLWWAVMSMQSSVRFMQSGAHPDDETSSMLAALTFREGMSISYACANRGEGGQNDLGTELTEDLGVLRTAEMERAADILGMRLYWLSMAPDDAIFDFGFSKSGKETLQKWGKDRTIKRFVDIVREERPDVLCPTFLDIPGQHGHHRAMTEAAHLIMEVAADPAYAGSDLPPWTISKLFLPAWSGAGGSYDDEVPPPPATVVVTGTDVDPVSGWSWARIGQQSRAFHRTQGMGRWAPAGSETDWPLHLAMSRVDNGDPAIQAGLIQSLADIPATGNAQIALLQADQQISGLVSNFADSRAVIDGATQALQSIREIQASLDDALRHKQGHRLDLKSRQLARVIRLAAGIDVAGQLDDEWLRPGARTGANLTYRSGLADAVSLSIKLPADWAQHNDRIGPNASAAPTDPYPAFHDPLNPRLPAILATVTAAGESSESLVAFELSPVVLPERSGRLVPAKHVLNRHAPRDIVLDAGSLYPADEAVSLIPPPDWQMTQVGTSYHLTPPPLLDLGRVAASLTVADHPALESRAITYPHVAPRARYIPAQAAIRVLDARLPDVRVGYIGGGNDRVGLWLERMGLPVENVSDASLNDPASLDRFDSLVLGIFAMRFRSSLPAAMPAIHSWVDRGGTLVSLYHRPWDNWDPDRIPPRRLEIGQPSLRWRVTDEQAAVHHLVPDHPLLSTPNLIGPDDWAGWHKERGLYFAKSWDAAYTPILEMADPDEAPHRGALLSATIGAGRHTHCALILHHQMEHLVPGAFRLMANLVAPPG